MSESGNYYIGLMSGTSADAIDVVLVNLSENIQLVAHHSEPLSAPLRKEIHQLATPGDHEIDRAGELDRQLGELFAEAVNSLLSKTDLTPKQITAIGSHGQTIRHRPPKDQMRGFTLQIGDPNVIAQNTGITTVADFRRRDMAAGGQGAPLVPAFHRAIFASSSSNRVVANIGGIANITWLPTQGNVIGFDTGPGNGLMDAWINEHQGYAYDANGDWAASGRVHPTLLQELLDDSFFKLAPPKSTGREAFNPEWLRQILKRTESDIPTADVQASLLELTAQTIADSVSGLLHQTPGEVFVCGGGAYNSHLMEALQKHLPQCSVNTTLALGVPPEWVEAMAFAWLAQQTLNRHSGNLRSVTGANAEVILGGVYYA
jgi:anhydro-N-acetylmuramic acid kinase